MNYFELYELPIQFHPDQQLVKQKFYANSKKFHPDFYVQAAAEKQEEILELSSQNNKAYNTLKNDAVRLAYVLSILGIIEEGEHYKLPQAFLMDMMDINESLMEMQFEPDPEALAKVKTAIEDIESEIQSSIDKHTQSYDAGNQDAEALNTIKDLYYRSKYLLRLKEQLEKTSQ